MVFLLSAKIQSNRNLVSLVSSMLDLLVQNLCLPLVRNPLCIIYHFDRHLFIHNIYSSRSLDDIFEKNLTLISRTHVLMSSVSSISTVCLHACVDSLLSMKSVQYSSAKISFHPFFHSGCYG